jgi:archaellum component FlaC
MEDCMGSVKEQMDCIKDDVESIKTEMHPNSGTTIRDSLNRIETRVQILDEKLIEHVNMSR